MHESEREKAAVNQYNEIINDKEVPPSTANLLIKQRNHVEAALKKAAGLEVVSRSPLHLQLECAFRCASNSVFLPVE